MTTVAISGIKIGSRHRKAQGDIKALAASIADVGLLHPIVLVPGGKLIVGYRRLLAVKQLGWTEVPAVVVKTLSDAMQALKAERDENTCRLDFAPTEAVALGLALEAIERPKAKERERVRKGKQPGAKSGKLPHLGDTRDDVRIRVAMR